MPIYEFYCAGCHTIFQFFAHSPNTRKRPDCPKCGRKKLEKAVSSFAIGGEKEPADDLPVNEADMERALASLATEAQSAENDPKQAAKLMEKFSEVTGMPIGDGMREAMRRLASGEDPEKIEADMGDVLDGEDPFAAQTGGKLSSSKKRPPQRDDTLYEM